MNSYNKNHNRNNKNNIYHFDPEASNKGKVEQIKFGSFTDNYDDLEFGFPGKNQNFSGFNKKNTNKFYDQGYGFEKNNNSNKYPQNKGDSINYQNKRKFTKNDSDEELEVKMFLENSHMGNSRTAYIEKNITNQQKNFNSFNLDKASSGLEEHKINYKLQKKIKKGELEDEVEIINSFARGNNAYLPIEEFSREFIYILESSNVVILMGETGSGKTTKIPEFLFKCGKSKIAHILPRKISAMTVAQRVAKNMNFTLGKEVGYSVRFDYNYCDETKIKFLTEGMFIREILSDPLLNSYNYIIVDDCHERTINSEIIFGILKKIFNKRKDLKIIISSATLDYDAYLNFFSKPDGFTTNIFVIPGRTYPVDIYYSESTVKNYVEAAISTAITIHKNFPINSGDILIFLTGQEEINNFIELSGGSGIDSQNVIILPLCSGLNIERQLEVFKPTPHNKRKIVLSTNIAEASVTIDNIGYVIDSCFVKMKFYNSKIDSDALYVIPASKFSLDQRAGRAGRTRPGKCFRLITKQIYDELYVMTNPELLRNNLHEFVLRIKSMGVKNLQKFETITKPDPNTISRALETLYFIGIINEESILTEIGLKASDIPIDSRLSVALINSGLGKFKCTEELLIICSMLSIPNLFHSTVEPSTILKSKQKHGVVEGDHLTYLSIYKTWKNCKSSKASLCKELHINENSMKQTEQILNNLKLYLKKFNIAIKSTLDQDGEDILKSLLKGYFLNIAQKQYDGSYKSLRSGMNLYIHPTSVLFTIMPEFVFYSDIITSAKNYIKDVSKIEKSWILEIAANYYTDKSSNLIRDKHKMEVKHQNKGEIDSRVKNKGLDKNEKFSFEKNKEKNVGLINKEEIAEKKDLVFSEEDKIFKNDFLNVREEKIFTEKSLQNENPYLNAVFDSNERKIIKESEVEEDDQNNILNIMPKKHEILKKQFTKNNLENKKNVVIEYNKKKISQSSDFNFDEYFNSNEIKNRKMEIDQGEKLSEINKDVRLKKNLNLSEFENENELKILKFNDNDHEKNLKKGFNNEKIIENHSVEDEEERIAMLRRKRNKK